MRAGLHYSVPYKRHSVPAAIEGFALQAKLDVIPVICLPLVPPGARPAAAASFLVQITLLGVCSEQGSLARTAQPGHSTLPLRSQLLFDYPSLAEY